LTFAKKLRDRYGLEKGRVVSIVPLPDGISILPELATRRFIKQGPILSIDTGSGIAPIEEFDS
jgi:bifunctional DNA-binding transcriptional regulator/antitoxin component of YhaV-PrlF toxin-antitoxin module